VEKKLNNLNYVLFHNSKGSSRGVGILIKKDIFIQNLETVTDQNNNFILIKASLQHGVVLLGAVYGPNENDRNFFTDLEIGIRRLNCSSVVVAGDWNCTWDPRPANINLDVINMNAIPSAQRSNCLINLANALELTDPFRVLYPVKREFSYIPNARMNINRSRIDFFLINKDLANDLIDCKIAPALSSTAFDHKKITLNLGRMRKPKDFNKIDNAMLKNKGVNLMVKTRILECYLVNADPDAVPGFKIREKMIDIGRIDCLIRAWVKNSENLEIITEAESIFDTLPPLDYFENLPRAGSDEFYSKV
jgi:exonuclease III